MTGPSRRVFLAGTGAALSLAGVRGAQPAGAAAGTPVDALSTGVTRTWLGPQYWANRLQDWRLSTGRIECVGSAVGMRTVGVLPRAVEPGPGTGALEVRTGTLAQGAGFSGFLVGAGAGALHWKAAALVMSASGQGGGLLAVYDRDGVVRFRDHTDEAHPFAYAVVPSDAATGQPKARSLTEDVTLRLAFTPSPGGGTDLELTARVTRTGVLLSRTVRRGVADVEIVGGISLVSARTGTAGTRHWLSGLTTEGPKVGVHDRALGPVVGTLYSLSGSVLKLNAQLTPIGAAEPQTVVLQGAPVGTSDWSDLQRVPVGDGYCASFRVEGWDATGPRAYRVGWAVGTPQESWYEGVVRAEPDGATPMSIAMINCTIHAIRVLEVATNGAARLPGEAFGGLYTRTNLYFPYAELAGNVAAADPDLVVTLGDQYYENQPTRKDRQNPLLDVLGKYYLWLWSFGDLTRDRPTLALVDDHDMFQGNLWGWDGRRAPNGDANEGGYVQPPAWVNTVQRLQCGHNPDAYDPTPVLQGISVYYAAFSYGGVSFALLEDRKFKNTNATGTDAGQPLPLPRDLLGARQERFLADWAGMHPGQPKVCFTQTLLACVQTGPDGRPIADPDSNGAPVGARRRAVTLLKAAGALVLSGDQHLGSLVRHGIDAFTDGPLQFTAPAAGSAYQRWFQPPGALPNPRGPGTGEFTDAFGNQLRVLAVANPKVTAAQVRAVRKVPYVGDPALKSEGYGLVDVDPVGRLFTLHCWPWQHGPADPGPGEYDGWPYALGFDAT